MKKLKKPFSFNLFLKSLQKSTIICLGSLVLILIIQNKAWSQVRVHKSPSDETAGVVTIGHETAKRYNELTVYNRNPIDLIYTASFINYYSQRKDLYGLNNYIRGGSEQKGNAYGFRNYTLPSNNATGTQYGIYNYLYNPGTGRSVGFYNRVHNIHNSATYQYGIINSLYDNNDNNYYKAGIHNSTYGSINSSGTRIGIYNNTYNNSTNYTCSFGLYNTNRNYNSGTGIRYGIYNQTVDYSNSTGSGSRFGLNNAMYDVGDSERYKYGIYNLVYNRNPKSKYTFGAVNYVNTTGSGHNYGFSNMLYNSNSDSNSNSSNSYGIYNRAYHYSSSPIYALYSYVHAPNATVKYAGYFSGDVHVTGNLTCPSDSTLKTGITPVDRVLDQLMQLQVKSFNYKTDDDQYTHMNLPEGTHYGLIAQEVAEVLPELVKLAVQPAVNSDSLMAAVEDSAALLTFELPTEELPDSLNLPDPFDTTTDSTTIPTTDDLGTGAVPTVNTEELPMDTVSVKLPIGAEISYQSVNYLELVPVVIRAIQEQQAFIEQLQAENNALKNENVTQNDKLELLKNALKELGVDAPW